MLGALPHPPFALPPLGDIFKLNKAFQLFSLSNSNDSVLQVTNVCLFIKHSTDMRHKHGHC